jgi:hypothetical protein
MHLLYQLAEWHALAKLRMHTESTLTRMDSITTKLAHDIRKFKDQTCSTFVNIELQREAKARSKRQQNGQVTKVSGYRMAPSSGLQCPVRRDVIPIPGPSTPLTLGPCPPAPIPPSKDKKKMSLTIHRYKFHVMADYVQTIRMFGTTDSYSTQTVSS